MQVACIKRIIAASISEVWAITSAFGAMRGWMPGVLRCALEGAGVGAVRTVHLAGGAVVRERLEVLDPARHRVRYAIIGSGTTGAANMVGGTDLEALDAVHGGGERTRITWIAEADAVRDLAGVRAYAQRTIVSSLDGLARLLGAEISEG